MIKLIVGKKGSGKTKALVDMINNAAQTSQGSVICIDKSTKLTYDIKHTVRLCDVDVYKIEGFDMFYGFVCGLLASNYDISEVFVDSILKIGGGDHDVSGFTKLLDKLEGVLEESNNITFTVSAAREDLPTEIHKFIV